MTPKAIFTAVALAALMAAPTYAEDGQRQRGRERSDNQRGDARQRPQGQRPEGRAAARPREAPRQSQPPRQNETRPEYRAPRQNETRPEYRAPRQNETRPQYRAPRQNDARPQYQAPRQNEARPQNQPRRQNEARPQYQAPRPNDARPQYQPPRGNAVPRQYDARPGYGGRYEVRRPDGRRFGSARIIRPTIIQVVPYRPYRYRPSWSIGVYYGAGGSYPYGYTPRSYYDPIPGRYYGGLRITGAPRDARVFADGYYVGIVDDFDGIFQHMNLEAGPHHIEVEAYGFEPIAFDVDVRPGQTITFRADLYRPY